MNPLRILFLNISRIPPAILLSTIVGLAGVTAYVVNAHLEDTKRVSEAAQTELRDRLNEKGKAVFALRDIPEGQTIPSEALEERMIPKTQIPTDSVPSASLVCGRVAHYSILAGEIVSQHALVSQNTPVGFEAQLGLGQRAITFGVDNNSGVAGFIVPQSHIDILATVGGAGDTKVAPILSDVKVIAVGPTYQKVPGTSNTPTSNVTVAVDPDDAKKLVKAIVASKLYVTLRRDNDHSPVATVDVTSLFSKAPAANKEQLLSSINQLPPPPLPVETKSDKDALVPNLGTIPAPKPLSEVEMWSGSRKDLLSVPNS
ncbi:MAG TPA: Flp pilus assembly protein CpaB [Oculatellaceae cyanobacterium]